MFEYLHFERFCGLNVYVDLLPVFIFAIEIICHLNVYVNLSFVCCIYVNLSPEWSS